MTGSDRPISFGVTAFCTDQSATPAQVAVASEDAGFEVLLFPDHTHVPVSRSVPFPGGGSLPEYYLRTYDPLVASAWAISASTTLQVGVGVCLVAARDPIVLAKQVGSLDHMSGGRFLLGVGAGWNTEEIANHGVTGQDRWDVMRERVLAMKRIWSDDEAEFHGRHVSFDPIWSWPKPLRAEGPQILVGGHGDSVLDRVIEYGDEWLVMPARGKPPLRDRIRRLRELARSSGRDLPRVSCQLYGSIRPDLVERLTAAGVDRIDVAVQHGPPEQMIAEIGQLGRTIAAFTGSPTSRTTPQM